MDLDEDRKDAEAFLKRHPVNYLILSDPEGISASAEVQPWERGRLAKPHMALDADPLLSGIDAHTYNSKEAASGGNGPAGGGCGCN